MAKEPMRFVRCAVCHRKVWHKISQVVAPHKTPIGDNCPMSGKYLPTTVDVDETTNAGNCPECYSWDDDLTFRGGICETCYLEG